MKQMLIIVMLATAGLVQIAQAAVYTRLEQVSNQNGVLVVGVQAMSDKGPALISLYRGAFRISETLEQRVTSVSFDHLHFFAPAYFQEAAYNTPTRLVGWAYKFDRSAGLPYTAIGGSWTSILHVVITYNQDKEKAEISWVGGPSYMVRDQFGIDISGSLLPVPAELQDIPLPVQVSLFDAKPNESGAVQIKWRTESELNNLGFNLYRSDNEFDGFERINEELIEGHGTTAFAHDYSFTHHTTGQAGSWYLLESVSIDGLTVFEGPVQVAAASDIEATPAALALVGNYPNPFNPTTEIRYTLSSAAWVELKIYDLRGKMIRQLTAELQAPGAYTVTWNGSNAQGRLAESGVYILELKTGQHAFYHKMTLMK